MANTAAATKSDTLLGRLVVDQGLCTQEELNDCLALQSHVGESGSYRTLAGILVANGCITESQLRRVRAIVEEQKGFQQIPGYQILSRLGAGAMAVVYKARQLSLDRIVAIKVLPRKMSETQEFVDRFYMEGKAAAKLNHPNIVAAYDVGEAGGYHYFVMEYVEGKTVYDQLADRHNRYTEKEALNIVIQVCRALVHAHQHGLIHRDVKPKNIMITPEGVAKLADMGLARMAGDQAMAAAEAGKAYGTPYYISPEQIRGEINVDFRADIYSLGATFYHMVTGRLPFEAASPTAVMYKHLREELVPPDHIVKSLSAGVAEVIEVAMAKDPKKRYNNTEDMLADLEALARGEPPLVARKTYDLRALATLEKTDGLGGQKTIDLAPPSFGQKFNDPLVLGLFGALLIAAIVIVFLLLRR